MSGETPQERLSKRAQTAKQKLADALSESGNDWTPERIEAHLDLGRDTYWLTFDTAALLRHAEIIRSAAINRQDLRIELNADEAHDATEVVVFTVDHPGLFAKVAGALSLG